MYSHERVSPSCYVERMKIFVTGGAGYVGSVCVEHLLNRGDEVVVFDNLSEGNRQAVDPRATFIRGDLNDPNSILLAIETSAPAAVMHFAARCPGIQLRRSKTHAARAIHRDWLPPGKKRNASSIGSHSLPRSKRSSRARGAGMLLIRMGTRTKGVHSCYPLRLNTE
jgi:hypothetical protein